MTLLWLCFALIAIVAVLSLALPVARLSRKHHHASQTDRNQLNIGLFRERSAELDQELSQGSIDPAQFALLQAELQQSLLGDVSTAEPPRKRINLSAGLLMGLVVMALPLSAWWLYDRLGSAQVLGDALWLADTQKEIESASNMSEMLERLSRRVQDNPDNIDGVILQGRSYMALQRYQEAADAFKRVAALVEARNENPAPAYGLMAQALFFKQDAMTAEVRQALDTALRFDPNESNALSLLGIDAFQKQAFAQAIGYWEQVIAANPGDANAEALQSGIARARSLQAAAAGSTPAAEADTTSETDSTGKPDDSASEALDQVADSASLLVSVSLAADLASNLNGSETVFILARPADGSRMPLAVTRTTVSSLPVTVRLDDSMAMGPMAKLSSVKEVEVIARVSRSGQPVPQAGDLEGSMGPVAVGNGVAIALVISRGL